MTMSELTEPGGDAKALNMQRGHHNMFGSARVGSVLAAMIALSGCINVNAPNDAIVIELNINIRQEVIYRLAEDAANTIEENADIF